MFVMGLEILVSICSSLLANELLQYPRLKLFSELQDDKDVGMCGIISVNVEFF